MTFNYIDSATKQTVWVRPTADASAVAAAAPASPATTPAPGSNLILFDFFSVTIITLLFVAATPTVTGKPGFL